MSQLRCPVIEKFTEVDMLSSEDFINANHKIVSMTIRNHTTNGVHSSVIKRHKLPDNVTLTWDNKVYSEIKHSQTVIRFTLKYIDPVGGIERLQQHLKDIHPTLDFYVVDLITQTTCGEVTHICGWKRKPGIKEGGAHVLRLRTIDGKKAVEHYSQDEMYNIAGSLADNTCKLSLVPTVSTKVLCN